MMRRCAEAEGDLQDAHAADWMKALDAAGAPAEMSDPLFSQRLFDDPLLRERGWTVGFDHKDFGFSNRPVCWSIFRKRPAKFRDIADLRRKHEGIAGGIRLFRSSEIDEMVADKVVRQA